MKIYTRAGDDGSTVLFGGGRVAKCDPRIRACGSLDELNAALGVVRAGVPPQRFGAVLERLQNQLFDLGAEVATPDARQRGTELLTAADISTVEAWIDTFDAELPELKEFILPGGSLTAAQLHLARCVCRRAEREIIALSQESTVRPIVIQYVNRVGDLLFVLARAANAEARIPDVAWRKTRTGE